MSDYFELDRLTKTFKKTTALDAVSVRANEPSIIGLVGKNGSGKTTLLRHIVGLYLPTSGRCTALGHDSATLGPAEFARIGMAHQHDTLLARLTGAQFVGYVSGFYDTWDRDLETLLVSTLEIDLTKKVGVMSPGNKQKLSFIAATCHRPSLLLLDEPLSDLDPIVRGDVIEALLERFRRDEMVIVISSHLLNDVERIADRIVCLDNGRLVIDTPLDTLKERYAEWTVVSRAGLLPERFSEAYIVTQRGDRWGARVAVIDPATHLADFREKYGEEIEHRALNLDQIFRLLVGADAADTAGRSSHRLDTASGAAK